MDNIKKLKKRSWMFRTPSINREAILKLRYEELIEEIFGHAVKWVKNNKCDCNKKIKNFKKNDLLENLRECEHMTKDRLRIFGDRIEEGFDDIVCSGVLSLQKVLKKGRI